MSSKEPLPSSSIDRGKPTPSLRPRTTPTPVGPSNSHSQSSLLLTRRVISDGSTNRMHLLSREGENTPRGNQSREAPPTSQHHRSSTMDSVDSVVVDDDVDVDPGFHPGASSGKRRGSRYSSGDIVEEVDEPVVNSSDDTSSHVRAPPTAATRPANRQGSRPDGRQGSRGAKTVVASSTEIPPEALRAGPPMDSAPTPDMSRVKQSRAEQMKPQPGVPAKKSADEVASSRKQPSPVPETSKSKKPHSSEKESGSCSEATRNATARIAQRL